MEQKLIPLSQDTPTYLVDFDTIVYRGYDVDSESNKTESISIRKYPLCLYSAYRQILKKSDNPKIQYIADVQRYSIILGYSIIEHSEWFIKAKEKYLVDVDSENDFIQDKLDNTVTYTYKTPTKNIRRTIKTLHYLHEAIETTANILGINSTDLIVLCSLYGLTRAKEMTVSNKTKIILECNSLCEFIEFHQKY